MVEKLTYFESLICAIIKKGKIPNHIAFIMDGNRRYAKTIGKSTLKGYQQGIQALKKCLLVCSELQIKVVSLYCFSMENFNRPPEQVQKLMTLAEQIFVEYSPVSHILQEKSIKVRIVGDIEKLKASVSKGLKQVQERTKTNQKMTVNLCFAYDSLFQINLAKEKAMKKVGETCTYEQFKQQLLVKEDVDLMVRTSNESRLSNFLLVQSRYSHYVGLKQNWPELSWLSFLRIFMETAQKILKFQKIEKYSEMLQQPITGVTEQSLHKQ